MLLAALAFLASDVAYAQEPALPEAIAGAPDRGYAGEATASLAGNYVWEQRGRFETAATITAIAVEPGLITRASGEPAVWLAADERGRVWRSEDAGATWTRVLDAVGGQGAVVDEEALLLEAEAALGEELGDDEAVETSDLRDAAEQASARATDVALVVRSGTSLWWHPTEEGVVLAGRPDGIWRSDDGGRGFEPVDDAAATAFSAVGMSVVAGTRDGVRWSLDAGLSWIDVADATDGADVRGVAHVGATVFAATDLGLFSSADGLRWRRASAYTGPALAVVADPDWDGGLWVAAPGALHRSDDGGATFYVAARTPLRDVREILHLRDAPGHLLAATSDGPWESTDAGASWTPLTRLLPDPDVRDLSLADGRPVLAARTGIFRLVEPPDLTAAPSAAALPPVAAMVAAASGRGGLDVDLLSLGRRAVLAAVAPSFEVTFDYGDYRGRQANFLELSSKAGDGADWALTARACWGSCASTTTVFGQTVDTAEAIELGVDPGEFEDLYVVGDDVFEEGQVVAAASNVAQSMRLYRQYLSGVVADAWRARRKLEEESSGAALLPLREQVRRAIAVAELDARLDSYTDGAWSRARTNPEERP